ncbi:MAG: hypothetical protein QOK40_2727, partial [Miltoncostaeaceae bacterium]|nr:hypothetical protein [Miltoncostaeaceae bacterium]
ALTEQPADLSGIFAPEFTRDYVMGGGK